MKYILTFATAILISGCANKSAITKNDYEPYKQNVISIGDKTNAIKTLTYVIEKDNEVTNKVVFYIDKFPYSKNFDLCPDMKSHKSYKALIQDIKNGKTKIKNFDKVNCKSNISLTQMKHKFGAQFTIKALEGFTKNNLPLFFQDTFIGGSWHINDNYEKQVLDTDIVKVSYFQFIK